MPCPSKGKPAIRADEDEPAAWREHACDLSHCRLLVSHVLEHFIHENAVEVPVGEGENSLPPVTWNGGIPAISGGRLRDPILLGVHPDHLGRALPEQLGGITAVGAAKIKPASFDQVGDAADTVGDICQVAP